MLNWHFGVVVVDHGRGVVRVPEAWEYAESGTMIVAQHLAQTSEARRKVADVVSRDGTQGKPMFAEVHTPVETDYNHIPPASARNTSEVVIALEEAWRGTMTMREPIVVVAAHGTGMGIHSRIHSSAGPRSNEH